MAEYKPPSDTKNVPVAQVKRRAWPLGQSEFRWRRSVPSSPARSTERLPSVKAAASASVTGMIVTYCGSLPPDQSMNSVKMRMKGCEQSRQRTIRTMKCESSTIGGSLSTWSRKSRHAACASPSE